MNKILIRILSRRDLHIEANIRKFRATIEDASVRAAKRPEHFEESIEIVIPCYNHGKYLEEAFSSILEQTWRGPLAITFVNDNSSDDSLRIMNEIRSVAPDRVTVKILENEANLLQGGSLNRAISESTNQLLVILNADDILIPDCLEKTVDIYRQHTEIFMLGGTSIWFSDGEPLPEVTPTGIDEISIRIFTPEDALSFTHINDIHLSHSSLSFFRVAWEVVDGYFPRKRRVCSSDDRDFEMRVCSCFPVGVLDYPMEFYRETSSQGRGLY